MYLLLAKRESFILLCTITGLCGLVTSATYATGVEMMMGVTVNVWGYLLHFLCIWFCLSMIELVFTHVIVQLCYFILGSTKIVVRNRDLCGLILRVTSAELY